MVAPNPWLWIGFIAFILAMLALDLGVFHRHAHVVTVREATIWAAVWATLALAFAALLHVRFGRSVSLPFLTGYVIEEALSVDNIIVMVMIFAYFRVPRTSQHRVLFYGVIGALAMRGLFIGLGTLLIARFHWVLYVLGALLLVTSIRMAARDDDEFEGEENRVVRLVRRMVPMTKDYHGKHFFTVENARRIATPLVLVLVLVEVTDLVFAIDSIPAIFGVTRDPFIVFTSNIFAVLGLRTMYFLLAGVVERFWLVKYGVATILAFVGAKMVLEPWFTVGTAMSLGVVVLLLALSVVLSLAITNQANTENTNRTNLHE